MLKKYQKPPAPPKGPYGHYRKSPNFAEGPSTMEKSINFAEGSAVGRQVIALRVIGL